jgi:hypothetical protein
MNKLVLVAIVATLAAFWVMAGDYATAIESESRYCEMVSAGAWPDYEKSYDEWCVSGGYYQIGD